MIAALRDLKVGGGAGSRDEPRQEVVLRLGFEIESHRSAPGFDVLEHLGNAGVRASTDDAVDLWNQTLQLRAVPLRQTSGNDQLLAAALLRRMLENDLSRLLFRGVYERARVDDDRIGELCLRFKSPTRGAELGNHHLGIDQVFRAAEADERNASHDGAANGSSRIAAAARTPSRAATR